MWNRKNRTTDRRPHADAEAEGVIRRGLGDEAPPPAPKRVLIREEKQGFNPYDSRGAGGKKPTRTGGRRRESGGSDPYNSADTGAGAHRKWWD